MDDAGGCPECGAALDPPAVECPDCGATLLTDDQQALVEERMAAAFEDRRESRPQWAVTLTGAALGIAVAPLVAYTVAILLRVATPLVLAGAGVAACVAVTALLSRYRTPSEALSRGLYVVVAGVVAVVGAVAYESLLATGPTTVATDRAGLVLLLAVPAVLALLLARRAADRAARQVAEEPGRLHEAGGVTEERDGSEES